MGIQVVANALRGLRDFVWPRRCLGCDRRLRDGEEIVCETCEPTLQRVGGPTCPTCALPRHGGAESAVDAPCRTCRLDPPPQDAGFAYWVYDGAVSRAIQRAKYAGKTWRLHPLAAGMQRWCRGVVRELTDSEGCAPGVTAIPMHGGDLRERGFNAAVQMARTAFARVSGPVECIWDVLEQTRRTESQAGLTLGERRRNVRGAFGVREPERVADREWILFDDVATTGATLAEAGGELVDAGARGVYTVAAARTPRDSTLAAA